MTWSFLGLHDLRELDGRELGDGTEVFSHLVRVDPTTVVVSKEKLTVFGAETNKYKTARELLDGK